MLGSSLAHYEIELLCLPFMPYVALYGLMWPRMALSSLVWPYVASYTFHCHGHVCFQLSIRLSMALCDLMWSCMAFYGIIWSFLAVIDPNIFGLV